MLKMLPRPLCPRFLGTTPHSFMLLNWAHILGIWKWNMFYSWFVSESWELLTLEAYEPGRDWSPMREGSRRSGGKDIVRK